MDKLCLITVPGWVTDEFDISKYGLFKDKRVSYATDYIPDEDTKFFIWLKHIGDPVKHPNNKIYNGTVLDMIPYDWIEPINSGKITVVIDTAEESWGPVYHDAISHVDSCDVHKLAEKNALAVGINPERVIWLTGDMNAEEYCKGKSTVTVKSVCQFFWTFTNMLNILDYTNVEYPVDVFLICPNRFPKAHRGYTLSKLVDIERDDAPMRISFPESMNFIPASTIVDSYYKLVVRRDQWPGQFDVEQRIDWKELEQKMKSIYKTLPRKIDDVDFNTNDCAEPDAIYSIKDYYHKSAFCLVTETWAEGRKLFLSDAILAPILFKTPFLVVGCHKTMQFLKSKGFLTFESVIDESYDWVFDDVKRWDLVLDQVDILSRKDWKKLSEATVGITNYNFQKLFSLAPREEQDMVNWLLRF